MIRTDWLGTGGKWEVAAALKYDELRRGRTVRPKNWEVFAFQAQAHSQTLPP